MMFQAHEGRIGGETPASGNVISGNGLGGIRVVDEASTANVIQGNLIGSDATGTRAIGNGSASGIMEGMVEFDDAEGPSLRHRFYRLPVP